MSKKSNEGIMSNNNKIALFALMFMIAFWGVRTVNKPGHSNKNMAEQSVEQAKAFKKKLMTKNVTEETLSQKISVTDEAEKHNEILVPEEKLSRKEILKAAYIKRVSSKIAKRMSNLEIKRKGSCDVLLELTTNGRIGSYDISNCTGGFSVHSSIEASVKKIGKLPAPKRLYYDDVKTISFKVEG